MMKKAFNCVASERWMVSRTLRLTSISYSSPRRLRLFSRMRSKTTIVSCTENPITVSIAVRNNASTSHPKNSPRMDITPMTTRMSWSIAAMAHTP